MRKKSRALKKPAVLACLGVLLSVPMFISGKKYWDRYQEKAVQSQLKAVGNTVELEYSRTVPARSTLSEVLKNEGFDSQDVMKIVEAAKPYHDLARLPAGIAYNVDRESVKSLTVPSPNTNGSDLMKPVTALPAAKILALRFKYSPFEHLILQKQIDGEWRAKRQLDRVETRLVTYGGKVESSLWDSATAAEMDPNLIISLTEIFAWQVDFAREVKVGDRWRLSVEEKLVRGKNIGWGRILAAEYENAGHAYAGILHHESGKDYGYFAADGSSLKRMFLRSPLKFGHITSRFSMHRFHPILKFSRPHLGVDYGAPTGTPIMAVGDGKVSAAGFTASSGNSISIRHNSVYATTYRHMSGFAKGMHAGASVHQGQVIGYVGMTGLATGPHLHFEFYINNRFVDPLGVKFPSADPVAKDQLAGFMARAEILKQTLPDWKLLGRHGAGPALVASEITRRVQSDIAPASVVNE